MTSEPTLYILPWGLYPRRITIYLAEKFSNTPLSTLPLRLCPVTISQQGQLSGTPPSKHQPGTHTTVPILQLSDGTQITQSLSILEYLEDEFASVGKVMRGTTNTQRAAVRDILALADEITTVFGMYVHSASKLFEGREMQSVQAAEKALEKLGMLLDQIAGTADPEGPFLVSGSGEEPTMADCVLLSTVQFAREVYGYELFAGRERLMVFEEAWKGRVAGDTAEFKSLDHDFLKTARSLSVR